MDSVHPLGDPTRLLFLGEECLADGFRLIGFETYPNPALRDVDQLLRELQRSQTKAFWWLMMR
ncbi:hypothetical protein [Chromatium okenii]|uniref:hypothetical protein n=1 Tax=Chromatium okenii TaxID=61644 RepID=UPI003221CF83